MQTTLRDKTLHLVWSRPRLLTYQAISEQTGLPKGWLEQFSKQRIPEPSVNRVQTLYEFLSGRKLEL